eukprot:465073-Heterocapsa_arctica.AAC.1
MEDDRASHAPLQLCEPWRNGCRAEADPGPDQAELEAKYGFAIKPEDCVWPWLVRHAGWIIERFHIKQNGHS